MLLKWLEPDAAIFHEIFDTIINSKNCVIIYVFEITSDNYLAFIV